MKTIPVCPQCGHLLHVVPYPMDSYMNREQWESLKAGDYFCIVCQNPKTKTGYTYFWEDDLVVIVPGHNED